MFRAEEIKWSGTHVVSPGSSTYQLNKTKLFSAGLCITLSTYCETYFEFVE